MHLLLELTLFNMINENYNSIKALFGSRFRSQICENNIKIEWPKGFGVYIVWETSSSNDQLIYIGMTGKFKKKKDGLCTINSGKFSNRKNRWTPYLFQETHANEFSFKYGPKYNNNSVQLKNRFEEDAYTATISYDDLRVEIFLFSENVEDNFGYTPSLLEAKLLSDYLIKNKTLPPANFEA